MNISVQLLGPGYHTKSPGTINTRAFVHRIASPMASSPMGQWSYDPPPSGGQYAVLHVPHDAGFPFPLPSPMPHPCPRRGNTRVLAPALPSAQPDPGAPAPSRHPAPGRCPAPAFAPLHTRGPGAAHGPSLLFCRQVPLPKSQLGSSAAAHLHPHPPARSSQLPFITLRFMRSAHVPPSPAHHGFAPRGLGGPHCLPAPARVRKGSSGVDPHVCGDVGSGQRGPGSRTWGGGGEPMHRSLASLCLS